MTGQCVLAADLNPCEYYVAECSGCNAPHKGCGMFKETGASDSKKDGEMGYERKPRWYEEYYK